MSNQIDLAKLAAEVSLPLHLDDPIVAANMTLEGLGHANAAIVSREEAFVVLNSLKQALLDNDMYAEAAKLLWKPTQFSAEPRSVQMIFDALFSEGQVLVQGCASAGKSFSVGVWLYLDWLRDPQNTNILVVGPSENHLQQNLFSHLVNLHNNSAIPSPGQVTNLCISLNPHDQYAGIKGVVIPLGKKSAGRLQGVKVKPRQVAHPKLGKMTRLRIFLEEAENIHVGVWEDLVNVTANAANNQQFKVVAAYNPKDRSSPVGVRAEPLHGWGSVDIETSEQWHTKRGWKLIRLDGRKIENVVQGIEIYPGLQTAKGLEQLTLQAGGERTAGWYCADEQTEALTRRGWKKHDEVVVGDEVWALNLKTSKAEWSRVEEVFSAPFSGELLSVEGRSLSALVTPDHRWPVTDKLRKLRGTGFAVKQAKDITPHNILPLVAGPSESLPEDEKFCALLGWVLTDGTVGKHKMTIYQSVQVNAHKCGIIRELLKSLGISWSESKPRYGVIAFNLHVCDAVREVRRLLGNPKRFPLEYLASVGAASRKAFLHASILGDGGIQGGSTPYVTTVTKEHADGFVAVAALCGVATTVHVRPPHAVTFASGRKHGGTVCFSVDFIRHTEVLAKHSRFSTVRHVGHIWCPRTGLSTWLCRRKGHVHFTGNTMAAGWYPEEGVDLVVIPPALTKDDHVRGEYLFAEEPVNVASLDVALEGGDNAILCLGRYGRALGLRKHPDLQHPRGEEVQFKDARGQRYMRNVLQVDQFILLPKGRTEELVDEVIKVTRAMGIRPEWLGVDRTGNGAGVHDLLRSKLGDAVKGINSSTSSTDHRILAEDTKLPCDEYNMLATELWFAVKKWIEVGVMKFAPTLPADPLVSELSSRRYIVPVGNPKIRVESKKEYKSRGNKSPDRADALTLLLHTVRLQTGITQSFSAKAGLGDDWRPARQRIGATDRPHRLD